MTLKYALLGVMAASLLASACNVDRPSGPAPEGAYGYYFTGVVYNGLTGEPLETAFAVSLQQATGSTSVEVKKGEAGAFEIGPLKPGSDYVITVDAGDGYRPFFAAEPMKAALPNNDEQQVTQYYEAYLFPTELQSPPVTLEFYGAYANTVRPEAGSVRFAPAAEGTSALNLTTMTPSVSGQTWGNDADRKVGAVTLPFTDGVLTLEEGALVYGVTYTGTVYDVAGHGYKGFNFTAGVAGHQTIALDNLADEPLQLISRSTDTGDWSENGTVTYTFNQPIEYAAATPDYVVAELIDDRIAITTVNANDNDVFNVLIRDSATTTAEDDVNDQERGTKIAIDGNTLTISWPGFDNASSYEPDMFDLDDLRAVTYTLTGISLRRVGATDGEAATLASLAGNAVTIQLKEPQAP